MRLAREQNSTARVSVKVRKEDAAFGFEEWSKLIDAAFLIPAGYSFVDDFPVWDPKNGAEIHRWNLRDNQSTLLSTVSARVAYVQCEQKKIRVVLIGAVASLPGHQDQGYASQCFETAIKWVETKSKADVAILWGSETKFYSRYGFDLGGEQCRMQLEQVTAPTTEVMGTIEIGWNPAIFDCMTNRSLGIKLGDSDVSWMESHKNVLWCSLKKNKEIVAYTAIGRGIDLPKIVHEWGGDPESLKFLLMKIREKIPGLSIIGPRSLLQEYGLAVTGQEITKEKLCLFKVLNRSKVPDFEQLRAWFWGLDGA